MDTTTTKKLDDKDIGELWRLYRPVQGRDPGADLVLALIRKLVCDQALSVLYGNWKDRLSHPLRRYGIPPSEWDG
jgi:hypothetical protein